MGEVRRKGMDGLYALSDARISSQRLLSITDPPNFMGLWKPDKVGLKKCVTVQIAANQIAFHTLLRCFIEPFDQRKAF